MKYLNVFSFRPEKVFLFVSLLFGLAYLSLIPPMQNPDEKFHYMRVFQISEGTFLYKSGGYSLPKNFVASLDELQGDLPFHPERKTSFKKISDQLAKPLFPEDRQLFNFGLTGSYFPLVYLSHSVPLTIGRAINAPPMALVYLSRLGGLILFVLGGYWIIRLLPTLKWSFTLILLLPMSVSQSVAISSDGTTHLVAILATAVFLRLILGNDKVLKIPELIALNLLLILVALFKAVYAPVALFLLQIPKSRFEKPWHKNIVVFVIPITMILAILIWGSQIRNFASTRFDPAPKILFMQHHPFEFLGLILRSFWIEGGFLLKSLVARFGYLDVKVGTFPILAYLAALFLTYFIEEKLPILSENKASIATFLSLSAFVSILITVFGLYAYIYVTWTEPDLNFISGVQGRYFIPLFPLFLLCLLPIASKLKCPTRIRKWAPGIAIVSALFIHSVSVFTIIQRYYGF